MQCVAHIGCRACRLAIDIAHLVCLVHHCKVEPVGHNVTLVLGTEIIRTDDHSFGGERIAAFTEIGIVVLGVEDFARNAKLVLKFCLPLLAQRCRTYNDYLPLAR